MSRERLERGRPFLRADGYSIESDATATYNCFAWAAGDNQAWWQPPVLFAAGLFAGPRYWPPGVPDELTLESVTQALATKGYVECENGDLEPGVEKVAIYVNEDGEPKHAARQLDTGAWTSKMGDWEDIYHNTLRSVEGFRYGRVARFLRRPRQG